MLDYDDEDLIEEEKYYDEEVGAEIKEPFDPKDVDIITQQMVISNIVDRLKFEEIELTPDFQRRPGLWNDEKQSRLIESLIIKIPLPSFYFDLSDDEKLIVVDGLQRLHAIKRFIAIEKDNPDRLRLKNLEYLTEFNGRLFEELPIQIQRRIKEQSITTYIIRTGTPLKVKTSIFQRINTGGVTLNSAEIRNSVYRGKAANFLKKLASLDEFKKATRNKVDSNRMLDCEFVNRVISFYLLGVDRYEGDFEGFLEEGLIEIQGVSDDTLNKCKNDFSKAMKYSYELFGENAFRKINSDGRYGRINKPLYETIATNLASLSLDNCNQLLKNKKALLSKYVILLNDENFSKRLSGGTGTKENVRFRHSEIKKLFEEVLIND